jgi:hypothetical protein
MMLVTRKKYDADMAKLETLIADQAQRIAKLTIERNTNKSAYETMCRHKNAASATVAELRARLAKFTAPRARDGAGRFLPLPAGDMGEVRA